MYNILQCLKNKVENFTGVKFYDSCHAGGA